MKKQIKLLVLILIASFTFTSCDEQKKELKSYIEKFNNECPVPLGDIGSVNSVMFNGDIVEMKFTSNENYAPISSLSNHKQEVKEMICLGLSKDSSKKMVDKIIAAGVDFRVVFVGMQSGGRADFVITTDELRNTADKFSNMNDQQKLIVTMYIGSKIKLPIIIDNMTKLVGLSLTSDALKYKFEVNDSETGQNMDSSISFMKYITLSQMANSLKGGMMGERNRQFYQALINCNQGAEYEYHELQTGKRASFRISTDEIREVLNGKWDNQPTAKEWENFGNALEEFASDYGDDSIEEVVDSVIYGEDW